VIKSRSAQDRTVVIEHPYAEVWVLVTPEMAPEKTRDFYRFYVTVKACQSVRHDVVEENRRIEFVHLKGAGDGAVEVFLTSRVVSPKLKEALTKMQALNSRLLGTQRD